ncbi:hypothetical protein C9390_03180, partial [Xanthomonas vasicola pv. vasculorum]
NVRLYWAMHRKLPAGTSDAVTRHAIVEAKRMGIVHPDQLQSVTANQDAIWILGHTPGYRVKVDLAESIPPV